MTTITFDSQELVRELRTSGIPPEQAEAVVRVIVRSHTELATKADIDRLDAKIDSRFALVEAKIEQSELRMVAKLGAMMVVAVGVVAALVKLL